MNSEVYKDTTDRDTYNEAVFAASIKAPAVVTQMQTYGTRWVLTAKPESQK